MALEAVDDSVQRQAFLLAKSWYTSQKPRPLVDVERVAGLVYPALKEGWDHTVVREALNHMTAWTQNAMSVCLARAKDTLAHRNRREFRAVERIDVPKPTPDQIQDVKEMLATLRADLRASSAPTTGTQHRTADTPIPPPPPPTSQSQSPESQQQPRRLQLGEESVAPSRKTCSCSRCSQSLFPPRKCIWSVQPDDVL